MRERLKGLFNKKPKPSAKPSVKPSASVSSEIETAPLQNNLVDTDKLTPVLRPNPPVPIQSLDLPQFITGVGHSAGIQRDHNEDALFTLTTNLIRDEIQIPFGFYVIADGMGGH